MKYLLDTNACISYLNRTDSPVRGQLEMLSSNQVLLCSVVKSELIYGALKSQRFQQNIAKLDLFFGSIHSLPFDDKASQCFGKIRVSLEQRGSPIGPYDMQIAAIALANDLIVVTHNTREFSRIEGLKLIDWED